MLTPIPVAYKKVMRAIKPAKPKSVALDDALGNVLAQDVRSDIDMPSFNRAMMDGYALKAKDSPGILKIVGSVNAGEFSLRTIKNGECLKISTGAPVPSGADCVVMVEETMLKGKNSVAISSKVKLGENISLKGEDFKKGKIVARKGALISSQMIALLSSVGATKVYVYSLPSVSVVATGNELIEISEVPSMGKIRNTNTHALTALLKELGVSVGYCVVARDNKQKTRAMLKKAFSYDVAIITGGISMGERDFVGELLDEMKVKIAFRKVAIKPGKPFIFGSLGKCKIFSLPGNPVSAMVIFHLFVRPAIKKFLGWKNPHNVFFDAKISKPMKISAGNRTKYAPARLFWRDGFVAEPIEFHGSADIFNFSKANALIEAPPAKKVLNTGEKAKICPLTHI